MSKRTYGEISGTLYSNKSSKTISNKSDAINLTGIIIEIVYPYNIEDFNGWGIIKLKTFQNKIYVLKGNIPFLDLAFVYTFCCNVRASKSSAGSKYFNNLEYSILETVEISRRKLTKSLLKELLTHYKILKLTEISSEMLRLRNLDEETLKQRSWYKRLCKSTPYFLGDEAAIIISYFGPSKVKVLLALGIDVILDVVEIAKKETYKLCAEPLHGIVGIGELSIEGMEKCQLMFKLRFPAYIISAIKYYRGVLDKDLQQKGNTYLSETDFKSIRVSRKAKQFLLDSKIIIKHDGKYYNHKSWNNCKEISECVRNMFQRGLKDSLISTRIELDDNNKEDQSHQIEYDEEQTKAIDMSFNSQVLCVNGYPGTGKTTVVLKTIAKSHPHNTYLLVAPTGMAAQRVTESTGFKCWTMDMAIIRITNDASKLNKKEPKIPDKTDNTLEEEKEEGEEQTSNEEKMEDMIELYESEGLIIDESSMVNENLLCKLLKLLINLKQIIFVGDPNQISPIGYGFPYNDFIKKYADKSITLIKNHRVELNSRILVELAKKILNKENDFPHDDTLNSTSPCIFVQRDKCSVVNNVKTILDFYKDNHRDIQFIAHRNETCKNTNSYYFKTYNCKSTLQDFKFKDKKVFVANQRIIFTKNNYGKTDKKCGIFSNEFNNGEIDYIKEIRDELYEIDDNKKFKIGEFPDPVSVKQVSSTLETKDIEARRIMILESGKRIDITEVGINNIEYGTCITGNKSQGNEYPIVVLIIDLNEYGNVSQNFVRNLLYTICTRPKKQIIIISDFEKQYVGKDYIYGEFEKIVMEHDGIARRHDLYSFLPDLGE